MKFTITFILFALLFMSCESDEREPQEVEFTIDYSFSSGSMSRATNDEIYTKFFNDHIKTKEITPKHYSISFTEAETNQKTEVEGTWEKKGLIKLLEGKYTVSGTSINKGNTSYVRDSVALSFEDVVDINSKTTNISIKAGYNCALVFFNTEDTKSVVYYSSYYTTISETLASKDGYFYGFVKGFTGNATSYFELIRKNGKTIRIHTKGLNLENGKYYFFNDLTGGFDLEPMTPGN